MRRSPWIAAALACLAAAAQAEDVDFSAAKPKAIASVDAARIPAPFAHAPAGAARESVAAAPREPVPFGLEHGLREPGTARSGCERSAHDLCYDVTAGRIVYRGARKYMPRIGELTPESVSLRRHRIVFRYSF